MPIEKLLNANAVAEILDISQSQVYNLWLRGDLTSIKIGRSKRCRPSDVEKFIELNATSNLSPTQFLSMIKGGR